MIRKSEISLVALVYFYFRILPAKLVRNVFLPIEEFQVARFCLKSSFHSQKVYGLTRYNGFELIRNV